MSYPTLVAAVVPQGVTVTSGLPSDFTPDQKFNIASAESLYEVNADGDTTSIPLGQSGPFVLTMPGGEQVLCSAVTPQGQVTVWTFGSINGRGYNSTSAAAVSPGAAATITETSAQDIGGGGGGNAFEGTSPQNPVWLTPVVWVLQNNEVTGQTIDPYTYDNGTDGVGATMTQVTPADGALSIDSNTPALGDRVMVQDFDNGSTTGIYVVSALGDGATVPWVLTRASDADTTASLIQNWAATVTGAGELWPAGSQGIVTLIEAGDIGTGAVFLSLSTFSTASGASSTASGAGSTASGTNSTASGTFSTASGANSTASGAGSTASGTFSTASGANSTASGTNSTASGTNSTAYGDGQVAEATADGNFPNHSLASKVLGYTTTTDDTPTALQNLNGEACLIRFVDLSQPDPAPAWNKTLLVTLKAVARDTTTPGTDSAWTGQGVLRGNGTDTYSWVGGSAPTLTPVAQDAGASAWAVSVDVGTDPLPSAAAALIATVTGEAATNISWMVTCELDEVAG